MACERAYLSIYEKRIEDYPSPTWEEEAIRCREDADYYYKHEARCAELLELLEEECEEEEGEG